MVEKVEVVNSPKFRKKNLLTQLNNKQSKYVYENSQCKYDSGNWTIYVMTREVNWAWLVGYHFRPKIKRSILNSKYTYVLYFLIQFVFNNFQSVESHADPILLEASILCLTRLQLLLKSAVSWTWSHPRVNRWLVALFLQPHDFHCVFFWIGICAMQFNDKNLYAAGLSLIEQNLHNLDDMGALSMQVGCHYRIISGE